jgi:hypothetical protein
MKLSVRKCGNDPAIMSNIFGYGPLVTKGRIRSDQNLFSVKPPDQVVCTKFQFQSSHQRMNCTHNPSITKYLPVPMPLLGFEPNLCLNEKGGKFEF